MKVSASAVLAIYAHLITCTGLASGFGVAYPTALRRALPNSPNGYTPTPITCPSGERPSVRGASTLSPNETAWLERRRKNTVESLRDLLGRVKITGFDVNSYISDNANNVSALPNIAISFSGGGYRALQNSAGVLAAFDSRTENSTSQGHLGGLLQSATYVSGLSGGGWLTGSVFVNNFTTVTALRDDDTGSVWDFSSSIVNGPKQEGIQIFNTAQYYQYIGDAVSGKSSAGFETTITDYWGRALSFQLVNASEGGPANTWSSIALTEDFQNGNMPMPILVADERAPGETLIARNTTVFEFNPFEMGTWDPTAFGFVPMQYLGSNFTGGRLPDDADCVVGFDNAGFIMGTSSSLFNAVVTSFGDANVPQALKDAVAEALSGLGVENEDIADYPNPFFRYNDGTNPSANSTTLTLVDGGLDFQNIPLHPVIQPGRNVDVIFAVDSSADTTFNWPNGTALVTTYERSQSDVSIANGTAFPSIPDVNTMVNLGLNNRPTFFGCDSSNITSEYIAPLVVYIPNAPYIIRSNVSTFDPQEFNDTFRNVIIENGYDAATMGNGTVNAEWPACVGCAIISRSLERTGSQVPELCAQCFRDFCWDGTLNSTMPANYNPPLKLEEVGITSATPRIELPDPVLLAALSATVALIAVLP
jgi:lysophospholipase